MAVIIPTETLAYTGLSEQEMLIEIACSLYQRRLLNFPRAQHLCGLDLLSFQKELGKREIDMDYDVEDFEQDLESQNIVWESY